MKNQPDYKRGLKYIAEWSGYPEEPLSKFVFGTREYLREKLDVTDLSLIEGAYLRKCVERGLEAQAEEFERENGEMLNIYKEAAYLWLNELYGIDFGYCDEIFIFGGVRFRNEFSQWLKIQRERSGMP